MKRSRLAALSLLSLPLLAASSLPASAASHAAAQTTVRTDKAGTIDEPLCQSNKSTCVDAASNPGGEYVGHDEPSVLFKSGIPGSGNDMTYVITLPKDPKIQPNASGAGGATWNFQLRATFWFGLTMCDSAAPRPSIARR